jgi:hypothetical protein
MLETEPRNRLISLFNHLAGADAGARVLDRLLALDDPPLQIVRDLAALPAFEYLYKDARTKSAPSQGRKEADYPLLGLPADAAGLPFAQQFDQYFAPRLGKRAEGFRTIFEALPADPLLIIETGCMRTPGNWEGDGQSSFMFDVLARSRHARFFSIDIGLESIDTARRACSSSTQLVFNDSVAALHALRRSLPGAASLLYFDSFDFDPLNPMPSAIHHALELAAAGSLIGAGTILCVDDYAVGGEGGKGMILDRFFSATRARVLHDGYQRVWQVI